MVAAVVVLLALAAEPSEAPEVDPVVTQRALPRFRGALALGGAGGVGVAAPVWSVGPAVSFDVGVTFNDAVSLSLRGTAAPLGLGMSYVAGLSVDRALAGGVSLGVGLAGAFVAAGSVSSLGGVVPVRAAWLFSERGRAQVWRHGVFVFGEVSPGVSVAGGVSFLVTGTVGIGYGGW